MVQAMIARVVTAAVLTAQLLLFGAVPAAAHTELITSDPAAGASLSVPPAAVTLIFSEDISAQFAAVVVNGAGRSDWVIAQPEVRSRQLRARLIPAAPAGVYTVNYRVISADGHPVTGSFGFTVTGSGRLAPPRAAAPHDGVTPGREPEPSSNASLRHWEWVVGGVAAVALLVVGARLRSAERKEKS